MLLKLEKRKIELAQETGIRDLNSIIECPPHPLSPHFSASTSSQLLFLRLLQRVKYTTVGTSGITAFQFIIQGEKEDLLSILNMKVPEQNSGCQVGLGDMFSLGQSLWSGSFSAVIGQMQAMWPTLYLKVGGGYQLYYDLQPNHYFRVFSKERAIPQRKGEVEVPIIKEEKVFRNKRKFP